MKIEIDNSRIKARKVVKGLGTKQHKHADRKSRDKRGYHKHKGKLHE